MALSLQWSRAVVAVARERADIASATLVLGIETKGIVLLDRAGVVTSSIAPALRVGFIASATIVDARGDMQGRMTAPITMDPGMARHHLVHLGATQGAMRGRLVTVGVYADDTTREIVRGAIDRLRDAGDVDQWIEVLDPAHLRTRLARLLDLIEPVDVVRDQIVGAWDLALAFEAGAIDEIIAELRRRVQRLDSPVLEAARAVLSYVERHRAHADYGALLARGIEIPVPARHFHEFLPIRLSRSRVRNQTDWPL